ncbi:MAG: restriction endonuclease subunit R [Candidatus Andersenbacteria bacterium RIFCSPHIGHO2_02_FULL_45_11]|uniref:Restriction endonuclease subunit R n=1 Tax=Candidatus Andersenbacteria bacterium RIFCSPHIGHO2_12_FULL_45_11 TaxID=1797281 RepID=A0A1G1X3X5_9BACT|nr:MAG: restriction endonuclease subunit R [Candidatus Andersenbacteria bacterium RIFCSPHIGHO2_01_FULL_46_36]OGY33348.1 MAG: restriction endonuclease subunit R [Candidatus Andersenbacteria bacterium RIFCSPHIGHO2_02_FULL_45_11]OGY34725.1 MAG: restriction endonuclease subunit R [Candidatus Andersenbacteria bacterium RIFCSPHIGHO2_12_FULL_45_11]
MNESETRAEHIDPKLKEAGWGVIEGSKVLREFRITDGKIQVGGKRSKPEIADYILVYKNTKIGVIEAKAEGLAVGEGVAQAKAYAQKMQINYTYATNGKEIYEMSMESGRESTITNFPTPDELWNKRYSGQFASGEEWKEKFAGVPNEGDYGKRYYQEIAVHNVLSAVAEDKQRILLTMATGTGKTAVAFQIAWKLFQTRWNLKRDGARRPRILFLADRNILADQAINAFSAFDEDARVRINPLDIRKKGGVPMSGSVYFTIFQTFMSGPGGTPYFGEYPPDFFDLIIIDECHRGGANDESNWRGILEYFSPAVQLGLTATPKRQANVDTYKYFGDPVYTYSLKQGVNDGFLTPFKIKRISTTLDDYRYTSDDQVIEGEVEEGKLYEEPDFNRIIVIKEREAKRVRVVLDEINQNEKTIIFCATQDHALAVRDLVNQMKKNKDPNYCVRVTANDGARGEQYLREFQDNEKTIPTILTTSQKLSTGVDARNIRNIVLMRPVNSMIEFKQIIGRGTRLFDGKEYFTIYDFVDAYKHFSDPEWDGEPIVEVTEDKPAVLVYPKGPQDTDIVVDDVGPEEPKTKLKIKLRDGKEREIQHMISTSFWSSDGKPISVQEFMDNMFGAMPEFFKSEEELRRIWSNPTTRKVFLEKMSAIGYGKDELETLQKMIDAEQSDLFDVLTYISFLTEPVSRVDRAQQAKNKIFSGLNEEQKEFLDFVLSKYEEKGVEELDEEKLPILLNLKYHAIANAEQALGSVESIRSIFFDFQQKLYAKTDRVREYSR